MFNCRSLQQLKYHIIKFSKNYFVERNNLSKLSKTFKFE